MKAPCMCMWDWASQSWDWANPNLGMMLKLEQLRNILDELMIVAMAERYNTEV